MGSRLPHGPFLAHIHDQKTGVVITDPTLPDNPIIYVNQGFTQLTGYLAEEVIGCNCRFLQGLGSDPDAIAGFREQLPLVRPFSVELLNYRKDGTSFWNQVKIVPVPDEQGSLAYYVGIQRDVTESRLTEHALAGRSVIQTFLLAYGNST
ncbi:PAS sensor domain-containing protein [Paenibacillus ehimensis]|uniref:PAS sensor domain-containing protein n=1 Tax=Paenibacillus ehimensis TaxID=79264 RepID=A0ABT8VEK3_9BACL|nr:PAS sensor domain-containing protein [Paenibacillus ehimensis]MDO3679414.1 PAS sensor domain-containing protein [Paenibacillus ehimensis]MEC0208922.1 PAS sensor domain-containing protein [Paenibacillus ehimensis]